MGPPGASAGKFTVVGYSEPRYFYINGAASHRSAIYNTNERTQLKRFISLLIVLLLTGCAGQNWSNHEKGSTTGAGVINWNTNESAALIIPAGQRTHPAACMQMALTANDTTKSIQASVSAALLSVVNKIPASATPSDLAKVVISLESVAKALNTSTERTTYLQIGGFYLCQLQANGLTEESVNLLMQALINASDLSADASSN